MARKALVKQEGKGIIMWKTEVHVVTINISTMKIYIKRLKHSHKHIYLKIYLRKQKS